MERTNKTDIGALFFFLLIMYEMRTFLFQISPYITVGLTFVVLFVNICFIIRVNVKDKLLPFIRVLNLFLFLLVIYGLILIISGKSLHVYEADNAPVNTTAFLIKSITSLGPIYAFYDIGLRGFLWEGRIKHWFYIVIAVSLLLFVQNRVELIAGGKEATEVTNNMGYYFVTMIPFLVFFQNKRATQYFLLAFFAIMIVTSAKRGAMVVGLLAILFFFILTLKRKEKGGKIWYILITSFFIAVMAYFMINYYSSNDYLQLRMQRTMEGDSSFRDVIYAELWFHFIQDTSLWHQLFGYGAWATLDITVNYAHQDWLELLTDMGLLGVTIYLWFWCSFFKTSIKCRKVGLKKEYSILILVFIIFFAKSLFSMSFDSMGLIPGLCMGYALSSFAKFSFSNNSQYYVQKQ